MTGNAPKVLVKTAYGVGLILTIVGGSLSGKVKRLREGKQKG